MRVITAMLVMGCGLCAPGWASAQVSSLIYVANRQAATVTVIDARTGTTIAPAIAVGNGPSAVMATRDGRFAYVLNHDSDSISVLDGATLAVIKTIHRGAHGRHHRHHRRGTRGDATCHLAGWEDAVRVAPARRCGVGGGYRDTHDLSDWRRPRAGRHCRRSGDDR